MCVCVCVCVCACLTLVRDCTWFLFREGDEWKGLRLGQHSLVKENTVHGPSVLQLYLSLQCLGVLLQPMEKCTYM